MERKLTAILSADVQGYSRLMGDDEEATIRTLTAYRQVMTLLIQQHRGRVVDSPGDNLLAEFASAVDAVQGAVAIQQELQTRNADLPAHRQMHYRIGINVGDVVVEGERIYGDGVNIAARLESLAEGGGICLSGNVHEQVKNKLPFAYAYQGEQTVKNIADPVRVYNVLPEPPASTVSDPVLRQAQHERSSAPVTLSPSKGDQRLPLPDKPSIAVLPFTNMSADPEQEYFSDGITDDIITDLSKISGLFVIARNSTFTYKGQAVKVAEVGRELGVRHILEGSVRKAGNRVRINVQLIDAPTGGHVWAERYDRELTDIFALQDEITQKIVFALKVRLSPEEQVRFRQAPTTSLDAYDAYLQAEAVFWKATPEAIVRARELYETAITRDPKYATAHAKLAYTYFAEWALHSSGDAQLRERASDLAHKALNLDASLSTPHHTLGMLSLWQKRYDEALALTERAVALDPNDAEGWARLGIVLNYLGRAEDGRERIEQAIRLNPHEARYCCYLGVAYHLLGRSTEALTVLKRGQAQYPDAIPFALQLAIVCSETGREAEARTWITEIRRLNPQYSLTFLRQRFPFKDPAVLERQIAALRKAGLK